MRALLSLMAVSLCALLAAQGALPGDELLQNGDFEKPHPNGDRPDGWGWDANMKWAGDADNHWVVGETAQPANCSVSQRVPLEEGYWKLRVSCRVKVTDVQLGQEGWHDARIAMQFQDADGKMVGEWPNVLHFVGTMADWESHQRDYLIPDGARWLSLSCSMFSTTGKVEWDDVSVTMLKLDPVPEDATLPDGVEARWDYESAQKDETATRARACINGLWRFHPAEINDTALPAAGTGWGYYKVPGSWAPGTARMRPFGPDIWEAALDLNKTDAAWYQRKITVPAAWAGKRVLINIDNPKHWASVYIDGKEAGTIDWPGGKIDITSLVRPGQEHELSVYLLALPLEKEEIRIARQDLIESARAEVRFKGLCGDCYLESEPVGPRIAEVFLKPSFRKSGLGAVCELSDLSTAADYQLSVTVSRDGETVKQIAGPRFRGSSTSELFGEWANPEYWDLDRPNLYQATVDLTDAQGKLLDRTTPITFGFREFWIDGRDFYLNGKRIHLRCLDFFNHGNDFGQASYDRVAETFRRARSMGFNYVIHGNYDYEPQSFTYIDDVLRAGDDTGFPMSYSIRHIKRIWRQFDDPEKRAYWQRIVDYEVKRVRNHPSVFMWAMNHNFAGYSDDQNPGRMTGEAKFEPPATDGYRYDVRQAAVKSEQYVMSLDGTRPCYHHQSGSLSQMYTLNCYLCFTPLQERIEWLSKWTSDGIKPLFFVEFGLPHQASWGGHRSGPFIWTNNVNSEPLVQEFGAIYNGDDAYDIPQYAVDHYDTIARVYARKEPFHISSVLGSYWGNRWEKNFLELKTMHTIETWPAFRTWGISAILPWDQADLFKLGANPARRDLELETDWANLQRPGISPDWVAWTDDWLTTPEPDAVERTPLGDAFVRVNRETLAYIAGPQRRFTAKDHLFKPGEMVDKQAVFINDLRDDAQFEYSWSAAVGGRRVAGDRGTVTVPAGGVGFAPILFRTPGGAAADQPGMISLDVTVRGQEGVSHSDRFEFTVMTPPERLRQASGIFVYDPRGLTAPVLRSAGLTFRQVNTPTAPPGCRLLIIGREAIGLKGPSVDLQSTCAAGANVLIFEQSEQVLQDRWGFRTASPGARRVFVRQAGHPVCEGITNDVLRDWSGNATLLEPYPQPDGYRSTDPLEMWCGFLNTRTWQWGNYGSVASAIIEKPHKGNFSVILDCEFDQQYTPLMEWLRPQGRAIFCQIDFSGRDAFGPGPERLLANLLRYAQAPNSSLAGRTVPASLGPCQALGSDEFTGLLTRLGVVTGQGATVVIGPGADPAQAARAASQASTVVCIGLDGEALSAVLPFTVTTEQKRLTHTLIGPEDACMPALTGLGSSEFHWRAKMPVQAIASAPEEIRMVSTGVFGEGIIGGKRYVMMQSHPLMFDYVEMPQLKRTWRHSLTALSRVLTNCGVEISAPISERIAGGLPTAIELSGTWRFIADPEKKLQVEQVIADGFDDSAWQELETPGAWESLPGLANYDGQGWYRKVFELETVPSATSLMLKLGAIDDEDWSYLNGKPVGHVGTDTHPDNYWEQPREYPITPDMLRAGKNVLAVRVNDLRGSGGIMKGPLGIYEPGRWLASYYLDEPVPIDDPYRYNRW